MFKYLLHFLQNVISHMNNHINQVGSVMFVETIWNIQKHMQKNTTTGKIFWDHFLKLFRTRVLETRYGWHNSAFTGSALSEVLGMKQPILILLKLINLNLQIRQQQAGVQAVYWWRC